MEFYSVINKNKICKKIDGSENNYVSQSDPDSERQILYVLIHVRILAVKEK